MNKKMYALLIRPYSSKTLPNNNEYMKKMANNRD
jgi:hypothetical protein